MGLSPRNLLICTQNYLNDIMNTVNHPGYVPVSVKVKRALWNMCSVFLFRPFVTGGFRKWRIFVLRMFGAHLDWDVNVYSSVKIWAPWNLEMHHGSCLGPEVICYNQAKVILKDNVTVSQYAYLCTAGHETAGVNTASDGLITADITLERDSWVGTKAFIGMGVVVGEHSVVGATASVYKDVEPRTVVGGNPAKLIKRI